MAEMNIIVMGVAGSGKTTIGQYLAEALCCDFHDGDDYHSATNIEKMSQGLPLTDDDRAEWLAGLHGLMAESATPVVLACSALKEKYRRQLGSWLYVYLEISPQTARTRLAARENHFMPASLIDSQFDALERPTSAIIIDANRPLDIVQNELMQRLNSRGD